MAQAVMGIGDHPRQATLRMQHAHRIVGVAGHQEPLAVALRRQFAH
jgi:hypothetical protein